MQLFKMINQADRTSYEQFIADIESLKEKVFISEELSAQAKERVLGTLAVAGSSAYRWFNLHTINTHLHFFVPFLSPTQVTQGGIEAISADARAYLKAKKMGTPNTRPGYCRPSPAWKNSSRTCGPFNPRFGRTLINPIDLKSNNYFF
ncbi:hypothetical protein [Niabella hibiscisoli]|uniref:hypothetical protein n=1 Tax=Niabella hibiscisoli TaxID=1825928 RepID=UPI001F112ADD|nr:hypothetical protein [Niabella hibiscisoli]MCH5717786.1 hypothetical protein [Niabella hibiscisoli]